MSQYYQAKPTPSAFFWRRLQSVIGLFLIVFLIEHLLTNSQAALYFGDDGIGFIHAVNMIHNLPYLSVIELTLIGIPFLIHMVWGIKYLSTSKQNVYGNTGKDPHLPNYSRNHAYTWQRITSWILLFAVIGHVAQMRFINYPTSAREGTETYYMLPVSADDGLYTLSDRLGVRIYDEKSINALKQKYANSHHRTDVMDNIQNGIVASINSVFGLVNKNSLDNQDIQKQLQEQKIQQEKDWLGAIEAWPLGKNEVVTASPTFGTAELLLVRDTFKNPIYLFLYSLFVLAATYHAFNGLWTFCITWGLTLTDRSQMMMRWMSLFLMMLIGFLGLIAIWGSYLINLKH